LFFVWLSARRYRPTHPPSPPPPADQENAGRTAKPCAKASAPKPSFSATIKPAFGTWSFQDCESSTLAAVETEAAATLAAMFAATTLAEMASAEAPSNKAAAVAKAQARRARRKAAKPARAAARATELAAFQAEIDAALALPTPGKKKAATVCAPIFELHLTLDDLPAEAAAEPAAEAAAVPETNGFFRGFRTVGAAIMRVAAAPSKKTSAATVPAETKARRSLFGRKAARTAVPAAAETGAGKVAPAGCGLLKLFKGARFGLSAKVHPL
jgi:hypothetical protein